MENFEFPFDFLLLFNRIIHRFNPTQYRGLCSSTWVSISYFWLTVYPVQTPNLVSQPLVVGPLSKTLTEAFLSTIEVGSFLLNPVRSSRPHQCTPYPSPPNTFSLRPWLLSLGPRLLVVLGSSLISPFLDCLPLWVRPLVLISVPIKSSKFSWRSPLSATTNVPISLLQVSTPDSPSTRFFPNIVPLNP